MRDVNCCDKIADEVYNAQTLVRARNNGHPEDEAQDMAFKGCLCVQCMTWYEQNEDGKVFVVHIPTGKKMDL